MLNSSKKYQNPQFYQITQNFDLHYQIHASPGIEPSTSYVTLYKSRWLWKSMASFPCHAGDLKLLMFHIIKCAESDLINPSNVEAIFQFVFQIRQQTV